MLLSSYANRSLYEGEESDGGGLVYNDSPTQDIVVVLYKLTDTIQLSHVYVERKDIKSYSCCRFDNLSPSSSDEEPRQYYLHVYFRGFLGLRSYGTRQSNGYGFKVQSGESYRIRLFGKKDSKGNMCGVIVAGGASSDEAIESTVYKFGDMLLKPGLRMAKKVITGHDYNLKPDLYTDHRHNRNARNMATSEESSESTPASQLKEPTKRDDSEPWIPLPCSNLNVVTEIDESEVWGLFFEEIYNVGVSYLGNSVAQHEKKGAPHDAWISPDDIDFQEPYLFFGLPACAMAMSIFRSLSDNDGIVLSNSKRVVREICPESYSSIFEILMLTKSNFQNLALDGVNIRLTYNDVLWMQQFLLYSSSDKELTLDNCPSEAKQTCFRKLLSDLVGLSMDITQAPYFKENFLNVIEDIQSSIAS